MARIRFGRGVILPNCCCGGQECWWSWIFAYWVPLLQREVVDYWCHRSRGCCWIFFKGCLQWFLFISRLFRLGRIAIDHSCRWSLCGKGVTCKASEDVEWVFDGAAAVAPTSRGSGLFWFWGYGLPVESHRICKIISYYELCVLYYRI